MGGGMRGKVDIAGCAYDRDRIPDKAGLPWKCRFLQLALSKCMGLLGIFSNFSPRSGILSATHFISTVDAISAPIYRLPKTEIRRIRVFIRSSNSKLIRQPSRPEISNSVFLSGSPSINASSAFHVFPLEGYQAIVAQSQA